MRSLTAAATSPPMSSASGTCSRDGWSIHRTTLLLKCEGLDDAQRKLRPVPTSLLSLHGLVRHMAEVEQGWFQKVLVGDHGRRRSAGTVPEVEDSEMVPLDDADWRPTWRRGRRPVGCHVRPLRPGSWTIPGWTTDGPAPYGGSTTT